MRNGFDIFTSVSECPFPIDDGFIDLSCGQVVVSMERLMNKSFVVAEILISFKTILGDKNFAVLLCADGASVDIKLHVDFDIGNSETFCFEKEAN